MSSTFRPSYQGLGHHMTLNSFLFTFMQTVGCCFLEDEIRCGCSTYIFIIPLYANKVNCAILLVKSKEKG